MFADPLLPWSYRFCVRMALINQASCDIALMISQESPRMHCMLIVRHTQNRVGIIQAPYTIVPEVVAA